MIMHLNIMEILAAFMVLFAVIDILGSIPVILDVKLKYGSPLSRKNNPGGLWDHVTLSVYRGTLAGFVRG